VNKYKGFTIIELIVVITIIAVLTAIVTSSVNKFQAKSRDARRLADMQEIFKALSLYQADNGCIPRTTNPACPNAGGYNEGSIDNDSSYDRSSINNFLTFLQTNNYLKRVHDPNEGSSYFYRYYCYNQSEAPWNDGYPGLYLSYIKEDGGRATVVYINGEKGSKFICR
jgi:prepilin-type N-terminal cleavage/methylation domain-containing protein